MDAAKPDDLRDQARRHVARLRGFYTHAAVFVVVMLLLLLIDASGGGRWWVQWPLMGWGVGLAVHALYVFGLGGALGPEWEDRKIREWMDKR